MKTTEVFTSQLPVGEKLSVKRTRFEPKIPHENMKRISIVSDTEAFGSVIELTNLS